MAQPSGQWRHLSHHDKQFFVPRSLWCWCELMFGFNRVVQLVTHFMHQTIYCAKSLAILKLAEMVMSIACQEAANWTIFSVKLLKKCVMCWTITRFFSSESKEYFSFKVEYIWPKQLHSLNGVTCMWISPQWNYRRAYTKIIHMGKFQLNW